MRDPAVRLQLPVILPAVAAAPVVISVPNNLSATLTLTPYVCAPFHPISVGYVAAQATAGVELFTTPPAGDVAAEASKIV